ncbi:MAG: hypothetical protein JW772_00870 [Candidatus Diapherotrites archaeon]|nr:hypothetical protein [Candidatus Diapherotrites archaeon]
MFLELLSHALSLDGNWIAELVLNNIPWVFCLLAFVFFNSGGKKWIAGFFFTVGLLYVVVDLFEVMHWIFFPIIMFIPLNMALATFLEGTSWHKHELKIIMALFLGLSFIWTFFVLG